MARRNKRKRPKQIVTVIERSVHTKRTPTEVFAFFDRPDNVRRVTPRSLAVSMERHPADLRPGTIFGYRLRRWPLDLSWEVVVSDYHPPASFTNVKSTGYFLRWALRHELAPKGGGTDLSLSLEYEVPSGVYATLSNRYVIRRAMEELVSEQILAVRRALDRGE